MRLNKYVAQSLGISRRAADLLIESGSISIDGDVARIGQQATKNDEVVYKGEVISPKAFSYLMLNKPKGYVCSKASQDDKPTVFTLVPEEFQHLQIAGRLDHDSSGLLILTNDGDYALHLTHPRYQKKKVYKVKLDRKLSNEHQKEIENGVKLDDGLSKFELLGTGVNWQVTMHEGRNRQIRRTFGALGYTILNLHRIEMGPYQLAELPIGKYAEVDKKDF
jgi:23S rRNA pseudouridine2605 synthase